MHPKLEVAQRHRYANRRLGCRSLRDKHRRPGDMLILQNQRLPIDQALHASAVLPWLTTLHEA